MLTGDCRELLKVMPAESVHCCVTSPPYWGLRDYGMPEQLGLERDYRDYVRKLVEVFDGVRRVLRPDGTAWLVIGDCYVTGAGYVGQHPGGGAQGERWRSGSEGKHGQVGPMTQPNRLPQHGLKPKDLALIPLE